MTHRRIKGWDRVEQLKTTSLSRDTSCAFTRNREGILAKAFRWTCWITFNNKSRTTESQIPVHYLRSIPAQKSAPCSLVYNCQFWRWVAKSLSIFKTVSNRGLVLPELQKHVAVLTIAKQQPALLCSQALTFAIKRFLRCACQSSWDEPKRKERHLVANLGCSLQLMMEFQYFTYDPLFLLNICLL